MKTTGIFSCDGGIESLLLVDGGYVVNGNWKLKCDANGLYSPYHKPKRYVQYMMPVPKLSDEERQEIKDGKAYYYNIAIDKARKALYMPLFDGTRPF